MKKALDASHKSCIQGFPVFVFGSKNQITTAVPLVATISMELVSPMVS